MFQVNGQNKKKKRQKTFCVMRCQLLNYTDVPNVPSYTVVLRQCLKFELLLLSPK